MVAAYMVIVLSGVIYFYERGGAFGVFCFGVILILADVVITFMKRSVAASNKSKYDEQ